jgi:hypothetical protein
MKFHKRLEDIFLKDLKISFDQESMTIRRHPDGILKGDEFENFAYEGRSPWRFIDADALYPSPGKGQ